MRAQNFDVDAAECPGMSGKEVRAIIERLAYVGTESDRLVSQLPKEFEPKNWSPTRTGLKAYAK
ncbi:MAG: hypothetical protein OXP12_06415 [Thaumarchaeota archaeon]|nr:hypothetical protein [Nitrososphaerota archaeon]